MRPHPLALPGTALCRLALLALLTALSPAYADDAVQEAVEARLRPIAMSTITTLCGLAPLVLIPGAGTELYRGVGVIVMFGILGAAIVTLTLLPALTVFVLQWQQYRLARRRDTAI
ncbi:efflux RND transporter permease subunit [Haliea sp.]